MPLQQRISGLQNEILSLYRAALRCARRKDQATVDLVKSKFRHEAMSVKRSDFQKIEFMIRRGRKQLKLFDMPGMESAHSVGGGKTE